MTYMDQKYLFYLKKKKKKGESTVSVLCARFLSIIGIGLKSVAFISYLAIKLNLMKIEIVLQSNHGSDFNRFSVHNIHFEHSYHYKVRFS